MFNWTAFAVVWVVALFAAFVVASVWAIMLAFEENAALGWGVVAALALVLSAFLGFVVPAP